MKQTVITAYVFNPSVNQIDLSSIQGFTVERLYAIINITRNQLIYAVGQPTYGFVAQVGGVLTLAYNTSAMSSSDLLEIIYDTENTDLGNAGVTMLTDGAHNQGYTSAGEAKVSVTESLPAGSANIGSITNITGTISLPTNAAQESGGHLASIDTKLADDGSGNLKVNLQTAIPAGSNTIGAVTQAGSWTVSLASESIEIGKVDQGTPNTLANGWPIIPTDGTHQITVKAASTPAASTDTAEVVALSPNTPLPAGSNVLGAVTQSGGPWTQNITQFGGSAVVTGVGASGAGIPRVTVSNDSNILATQSGTWNVAQSGSWNVGQSGTWNIINITGTVSLPTGAATSALQTTGNTTLSSIFATQTNGTQETQLVDGSGHLGTIKPSGVAALTTDTSLVVALSPNSPLPAGTNILGFVSQNGTWTVQQGGAPWSVSQSGTWNINNISGTISLPTGASTSALQTTGNTSLASILANQTNGTQETQVTNFPSVQAVSQSGSWTVSLTPESIEIGKVDQGNPGTNANAWWVQIGDTTHGPVAVKAASTAAAAADPSFVVALSPNSPLPAGSSVIGAVTQSGTWNIGTVTAVTTVAAVTAITNALPAGSNTIGAVTQASGPWTQNITQFGGTNISTGTGASGTGIPRVTVSNDSNILATQSGTWTVQQGGAPWSVSQSGTWNIGTVTTVSAVTAITNALPAGSNVIGAVTQSGTWTVAQGSANTLANAWSLKITDSTNGPVAVKAASTAAAATDPSLVVALSPNSPIPSGTNTIGATASEGTTGSAVPSKATLVGGSDGTNLQSIGVQTATANSPASSYFLQVVPMTYNYKNISSATTTTVKSGAGTLHELVLNNNTNTCTYTIYDNTSATGTVIATITNTTGGGASPIVVGVLHDIAFTTGLTIVTTGTGVNCTAIYK